MMSRIGNHIYSKEADTAVQFYKDAFGLETKGEPWRDDNGLIISQNLYRKTGELFMTVCDYGHLPNEDFISKFSTGNCLTMLFYIFFLNKNDMQKTVKSLSENAKLIRDATNLSEPVCDIVDQFGVSWHLAVPNDESMFDSLKL